MEALQKRLEDLKALVKQKQQIHDKYDKEREDLKQVWLLIIIRYLV